MNQQYAVFVVSQRPVSEPVQQVPGIVCIQNFPQTGIEGLFISDRNCLFRLRQEMQVVIAQHAYGSVAQGADEAQALQRLWPATDQIAGEPETVNGRFEANFFQQTTQIPVATLQIADGIDRHQCGYSLVR